MKLKMTEVAEQVSQQKQDEHKQKRQDLDARAVIRAQDEVQRAVVETTQALIRFLSAHQPNVTVLNHPEFPKSILTPDVKAVVAKLSELLVAYENKTVDLSSIEVKLTDIKEQLKQLPKTFPDIKIPDPAREVSVLNQIDLNPAIAKVEEAIKAIQVAPVVKTGDTKVTVDTKAVAQVVQQMEASIVEAIRAIPAPQFEQDLSSIESILREIKQAVIDKPVPIPPSTVMVTNEDGTPIGPSESTTIGLFTLPYDEITVTYNVDNDVYVSKLASVTQQTVTVTYSDSSKQTIISAARS